MKFHNWVWNFQWEFFPFLCIFIVEFLASWENIYGFWNFASFSASSDLILTINRQLSKNSALHSIFLDINNRGVSEAFKSLGRSHNWADIDHLNQNSSLYIIWLALMTMQQWINNETPCVPPFPFGDELVILLTHLSWTILSQILNLRSF
jgi:hypothetical protein